MRHYSRAEIARVYDHILGERMPGAGPQDINVASTTQRYRTGSRLQLKDKVYHYAYAFGVMVDNRIVFTRNGQDSGMTAIGAAGVAPAGVTTVTVQLAAGGGPAQNGNMPANWLEGGSIIFMTAAGIYVRGILSNTAVIGGAGGTITIVIDRPTLGALVAADSTEFIASKYRSVVVAAETVETGLLSTGVGLPTLVCAAGRWLWLQTWGPTWSATVLTLGTIANDRSGFLAGNNGSIEEFSDASIHGGSQRVGTIMANAIGGGQGAPFFNLELDP